MSSVLRLAVSLVLVAVLAACGRLAGTPPVSPDASAAGRMTSAAASSTPAATPPGSDATPPGVGQLDLEALRAALLGPSPVPEGWEEQVDEIIATVETALASMPLPDVSGLTPGEAACATWAPLVGRLDWATGALVERQVALAHLAQLADVAPSAIRPAAEEATAVVAAAASEQLSPDGDPEIISTAPEAQLRTLGAWALAHCSLEVEAQPAPDAADWTEEEIAFSCDLDRRLLTEAMEEFRDGPGDGRYAVHPHELEIAGLDVFVYPAWHMLASVDNEGTPPTFEVEPIPGGFCDR